MARRNCKKWNDTWTPPLFGPESAWRPPSMSELPASWEGAQRVGVDIETHDPTLNSGGPTGRGLGPGVRRDGKVIGVSFAIEGGPKHYLPWGHVGGDNMDKDKVIQYLKDQAKIKTYSVVGANLGYDTDYLAELGIDFLDHDLRDIQVAEPLLNENKLKYSLDATALDYGFEGKDETLLLEAAKAYNLHPKKDMWKLPARFVGRYAEEDADLPLRLIRKQEHLIDTQGLQGIYDLERRIQPILVRMRRHGVLIDFDHLDRVEKWTIEQELLMLQEIFNRTNIRIRLDEINKKTLTSAALDAGGLPYDYTPTGEPKIDTALLLPLAKHDKLANAIIHAKYLNKLRNTFVASIRSHETNGRIHSTLNQLKRQEEGSEEAIGAGPGRMSCVPKSNEILTKRGWKKWDELVLGEDVMGYNVLTDNYEWTVLQKIHDTGFAPVGIVKAVRGHGAPGPISLPQGFYCTKEHKWVIHHPKIKGFIGPENNPRGFRKLLMPTTKMPAPASEKSILTPIQAFVFGWYLTDGWLIKGKRSIRHSMCVGVLKKSSISQLSSYLNKYLTDTEYTHNTYLKILPGTNDHKRTVHHFYFRAHWFNEIYEKTRDLDPSQVILQLSEESRALMFLAMLEGDGSMRQRERTTKAGRYDRFGALEFHNKRTWEFFSLLSLAQGQPYGVCRTKTIGNKFFLNFHLLQTAGLTNKNHKWRPEKEEDTWCPQTGLGTWVMRQGKRICVTGNSSSPNLQQQPGRLPEWWALDMPVHIFWRKIYLPDEGGKWAALDFSGQESGMLVHFSSLCGSPGAEKAVQDLINGGDFHDSTTELAFGATRQNTDAVTFKNLRGNAKQIFFGLVYGMGGGKLCRKLGFSVEEIEIHGEMREMAGPEGKKFLEEFHRKVPFLNDIKERVTNVAWNRRHIISLLGRHIHYERGFGNERKALNNLIQSSAADQVKKAMVDIYDAGHTLQLQVHDECDTTIYDERAAKEMAEIMEHCVELCVPSVVDIELGKSWGHSMEKDK